MVSTKGTPNERERNHGHEQGIRIQQEADGVIYRAWKTGEVRAEKATIDAMYRIAEDGFDEGLETIQKRIIGGSIASACQNLFAGLTAVAQRDLDTFAKYAAAA